MQQAVLKRLDHGKKQTLGDFRLYDDLECCFSAKSLELPWLSNQSNISCIPSGRYKCSKRHSRKYGHHYIVEELDGSHVTGRTWILIHFGNYYRNTKGCILLGLAFTDINSDGLLDVTSSKAAMKLLNKVADDTFLLDII